LKKIALILVFLIHLFTLGAFFSASFSPKDYPNLSLYAITIPFWILIELILGIFFIRYRPWAWLMPWLVLLIGHHHFQSIVAYGFLKERELPNHLSFSVLSYNVRVFNAYKHLQDEKPGSTHKMIDWIINNPAEIKCFQEFHHLEKSDSLNTMYHLAKKQGYDYKIMPWNNLSKKEGYFGLVILSKFPIVESGGFPLEEHHESRGLYADIKIGNDTVRIINVHLQSIFLDDAEVVKVEASSRQMGRKFKNLAHKIRLANISRAGQVKFLEDFISQSQYPIILTGDFNDFPWSYTYRQMKKTFYNAFEQAGQGFGISYNGKIPFLRIDNQFYSPQISILDFKTWNKIPYSDHYPIEGRYYLAK